MKAPPGKIVVVVDDNQPFNDMLSLQLADKLGCVTRTFTRPSKALSVLHSLPVGLIITDYQMPDMTGLDFVRAVADFLPDVPCIMISGHLSPELTRLGAALPGLKAMLPKPFDPPALCELVCRHAPACVATAQP